MVLFTRFVENGRVVQFTHGEHSLQLAVIVDVVNTTRVIVEGPHVPRHSANVKHFQLTDFMVPVTRNMRQGKLLKVLKDFDLEKKFAATAAGKKQAIRAKRAGASDFDRFKIMLARKKRGTAVRTAVNKAKAKK